MRTFDTGATRDTDEGKPVFGKFLSSSVLRAFGRYMHKHRIQSDGSLRDGDNWQKGMERDVYFESKFRHDFDLWDLHRGIPVFDKDGNPVTIEEACCAILFNVQGYLHEHLKTEGMEETQLYVGPPAAKVNGIYFSSGFVEAVKQYNDGPVKTCGCIRCDCNTPTGPSEYEPEFDHADF